MDADGRLARYAAPAAFLLAVTIAVLLIRAGLSNGTASSPPPATIPVASTAVDTIETGPDETTSSTGETTTDPASAEFYEIQSGDTLAVVADQHGTTVEQLLVLNPDVDPVALRIGQRIRVK